MALENENKAVIRRYFEEVYHQGREEVVGTPPLHGKAAASSRNRIPGTGGGRRPATIPLGHSGIWGVGENVYSSSPYTPIRHSTIEEFSK